MVSDVQNNDGDAIAQSSTGSSVVRGLRQLTLAITLPLLLLAASYEAATAGEIKATTAQGIVTFRAPVGEEPKPRKRQRITVRATANGVVTFRPALKCVPPKFLKNGVCKLRPPRITISPSELPGGTVASTYRAAQFAATGGKSLYKFSLADGKLPPGLRLSSAGRLTGTPTKRGAFGIVIQATDAQKFAATRAYSITIRSRKCVPPEVLRNGTCVRPPIISISPSELSGGNVKTTYSGAQFVANGGKRPHTFSLADGPLPPGLRLSPTGALTGTPTTAGAFGIVVKAIDARKFAGTRAYSMTIGPQECVPPEVLRNGACVRPPVISIAPSELPGGKAKTIYPTVRLVANGGKRPHTFALVDGALPPGLDLSADGALAGTPTKAGAYTIIVEAADAQKFNGTRAYSISIAVPADPPKGPAPTIMISPVEIPPGKYDTPYRRQFLANGGSQPYAFKVADGPLPQGLSLSASGLLAGTPTKSGTFDIVISATDAEKFTGFRAYALSIADSAEPDCPEGQVRFGANCVGGPQKPKPPKQPKRPVVKEPGLDKPTPTTPNLARPLQVQLKRLGCLTGRVDGIWGDGSSRALSRFTERAGLRINRSEPTKAALRAARAKPTGFCKSTTKTKPDVTPIARPECRRGYVRNGYGKCARKPPPGCREGYILKNGRCRAVKFEKCRKGYSHNEGGDCERDYPTSCPTNAYRTSNGNCQCNKGLAAKNGRCVRAAPRYEPCPANSRRTGKGQCQCNKNFTSKNRRCVKVQQRCPANAYRTGNGQCQCNKGLAAKNGRCVRPQPQKCGGGQYRDRKTNQCRCEGTRVFKNGRCVSRQQQQQRRNNSGGGNNAAQKRQRCIQACQPRYQACMRKYKNQPGCTVQAKQCLESQGCG
jgi:hypothetical protein